MNAPRFACVDDAIAFGDLARRFRDARAELPGARAADVLRAVRYQEDACGGPIEQAYCAAVRGHQFECTGTAYGGDDERWHGEGRCLCAWCGADGDA